MIQWLRLCASKAEGMGSIPDQGAKIPHAAWHSLKKERERNLYYVFIRLTCQKDAAATAKSLQSCPTLCDPIDGSPPGSPRPWDSPGKNTGVGCHFLLQCMKVKSKSEIAQSCPTLSDPMDCSLPGSSVHGICQARVLEWAAIAFSQYNHRDFHIVITYL